MNTRREVFTLQNTVGVTVAVAARIVSANSGKVLDSCGTWTASCMYFKKNKYVVLKSREWGACVIGSHLPVHFPGNFGSRRATRYTLCLGTHFFQIRKGTRNSSNMSRYSTPFILGLAQKDRLERTLAWRDQHTRYWNGAVPCSCHHWCRLYVPRIVTLRLVICPDNWDWVRH